MSPTSLSLQRGNGPTLRRNTFVTVVSENGKALSISASAAALRL